MSSSAIAPEAVPPPLDQLAVEWRALSARHRVGVERALRGLRAAAWLAPIGAAAALVVLAGTRQTAVALAWSLYLLWQFFFLARTKTLAWRSCGAFFVLGALLVAPLAAGIGALPYWVLNDEPGVGWIDAGWIPIVEETLKVVPLMVFARSARARTLSLTDLGLAGAAVGAGFAFTEESLRRLATLVPGSATWWPPPDWQVLALLPGGADAAGGLTFAGHAVLTAIVGFGIGLVVRYRRRESDALRLLPALLLLYAILDHMAWNAGRSFPGPLESIHGLVGGGQAAVPMAVALLACAVIVDVRDLNRVAGELPHLPGEARLDPLGDLRLVLRASPRGLPAVVSLFAFLRGRRQVGFGLRMRERDRDPALGALAARVAGHRRRLGAVLTGPGGATPGGAAPGSPLPGGAAPGGAAFGAASVLLLAGAAINGLLASASSTAAARSTAGTASAVAAVAVHAVGAGPWWTELAWYQQAAAAGAVASLAGVAAGAWTAGIGVALVARDAADTHPGLVAFRSDPAGTLRRWVRESTPPQLAAYGAARLLDLALRRVPPDDPARRAARHWPDGWLPRRIDVYGIFDGRLVRRRRSSPMRRRRGTGELVCLGFSHRGSIGASRRARIARGTREAPDDRGVYRGVVELLHRPTGDWIRAPRPTAFFPDDWSRARVLAEIHQAMGTAVVENGWWSGTSASGLIIEGRADPDGTVRTAHPRPTPQALPRHASPARD